MRDWGAAWALAVTVTLLVLLVLLVVTIALTVLADTWEMEQRLRQRSGRDRHPDPWYVRALRKMKRL